MFWSLVLLKSSQSLRTAVCHCSSVPAVWPGHRAIRLALEPELELEVQPGFLFPRQSRILMARRPRCPNSNIWSRTICWGCQSPHSPQTPDLSKESLMGDRAINALLEWFWSPLEEKSSTIKVYYHRSDATFAAILVLEKVRLCSAISAPLRFCVTLSYNCSIYTWWRTH